MKLFPVAVSLLLITAVPRARAFEKGKPQKPGTENLKPGDYIWQPDAAPTGAIDIVVSLGQQQLWVYRDGTQIGRSTISSGRQGFETPKGVYMILEKNVTHHSNKYHEASMPHMLRLTWGGLAIHAGNTPAKPESHGCMHVPEDFSKDLYGIADEGNTVLIVDSAPKPQDVPGVNALFDGPNAPEPQLNPPPTPAPAASPGASPAPPFVWKPEDAKTGPYLVVFSLVDKRVYVYRKGVEIGRADLGGVEGELPKGKHVYVALDKPAPKGSGRAWSALGITEGATPPDWGRIGKRWTLPAGFRGKLREIVGPGTTVVLTDEAADNAKPDKPDKEG